MSSGKVVTAGVVFPHVHYSRGKFVVTLLFWKDVID